MKGDINITEVGQGKHASIVVETLFSLDGHSSYFDFWMKKEFPKKKRTVLHL
jgi:hypothetical protein